MMLPVSLNRRGHYWNGQIPASRHLHQYAKVPETSALENRARSSLCQLSDNICHEGTQGQLERQLSTSKCQKSFSPWKVEKASTVAHQEEEDRVRKRRKERKYTNCGHCNTQDKQNQGMRKVPQKELLKSKSNSIFFRIMGLGEAKGSINLKNAHPDIEMVACLDKKKSCQLKMSSTEETEHNSSVKAQVSKTPKLINLLQGKKGNEKKNKKELDKRLSDHYSHKVFQPNFDEYWKGKSRNKKGKASKKVVVREIKSVEAREVRDHCLKNRRGSLSNDKPKREQYRCNNPLTRLLYEKYLYTIGINQREAYQFL